MEDAWKFLSAYASIEGAITLRLDDVKTEMNGECLLWGSVTVAARRVTCACLSIAKLSQ